MQPETAPGPDAGGGGGGIVPDGPVLPEQVPSGVRTLVDGIFSFGGDLGRGFGEFVSGLAGSIGGDGGAAMVAPELVQATVAVSEVVV